MIENMLMDKINYFEQIKSGGASEKIQSNLIESFCFLFFILLYVRVEILQKFKNVSLSL
jgi:hypothetical protein